MAPDDPVHSAPTPAGICRHDAPGVREAIEREVQRLTADLRAANALLEAEIAERKHAEIEARREFQKREILLRLASDGVHVLNPAGRLIFASQSFGRMLGYTDDELLGLHIAEWEAHWTREELERIVPDLMASSGSIFETRYRRKDGSAIDVEIHVTGVEIDGERALYASARDISHRRALESQIRHLAHHDELTGLPNRRLLTDRLRQGIAHARRRSGQLALLMLDLDGFKPVNDAHGHEAGDVLLRQIAARIQDCVQRGFETVARVGGDEFVVVLPVVESIDDPRFMGRRILASMADRFELGAHAVSIGISIGGAIYPEDGNDVAALLGNADRALFAAKRAGKNRVVFYGETRRGRLAASGS